MANTENQLGQFLSKSSVILSEVTRMTGITKIWLSQLTHGNRGKITACKLYSIAPAARVSPCLLLMEVCDGMALVLEN